VHCADNDFDNCIREYYLCDGEADCRDGLDEEVCRSKSILKFT
jgi:hypothetical protein